MGEKKKLEIFGKQQTSKKKKKFDNDKYSTIIIDHDN